MSLRAIIADDEALARNRILRLLEQLEEIEVVSSSSNGLEALETIQSQKPDIAFLDIEMPGMNGLDVARQASQFGTKVIFTTAYNEHAIAAFEINATDYLLKPFNLERLKICIDRVKSRPIPTNPSTPEEADSSPVVDFNYMDLNKIPIPIADKIKLVDFSDIFSIEVEDGETYIYTKEKRYLLNQTLEHFEKRLPPKQFLRISRSCIVSISQIKELIVWFGNRYKIVLNNGREAISSREKSRVIKQLLKF